MTKWNIIKSEGKWKLKKEGTSRASCIRELFPTVLAIACNDAKKGDQIIAHNPDGTVCYIVEKR